MNATAAMARAHPRLDKELWVGLFVIAGIAAVLLTLFTLSDPSTFRGRYTLFADVSNASGIRKGDSVLMRGVNIGSVKGLELSGEGVSLRLDVEREYPIPRGSRVELRSGNLLGQMFAEVIPGQSAETLRTGERLPGGTSPGPLSQVTKQAEGALGKVEELLSDETVANVRTSTGELRALSSSLRRSAQGLESATKGPELERSIKRLDGITERLNGAVASLERSSQSAERIAQRIERGEGSLGRLATDASLFDNANKSVRDLGKAAEELTKLTEDVRKNPKRYLDFSLF